MTPDMMTDNLARAADIIKEKDARIRELEAENAALRKTDAAAGVLLDDLEGARTGNWQANWDALKRHGVEANMAFLDALRALADAGEAG